MLNIPLMPKGINGAKQMSIYVRYITNEEGNRLKCILGRSNDAFKVKRAQVILASGQGMKVPEIHNVDETRIAFSALFYSPVAKLSVIHFWIRFCSISVVLERIKRF